MRGFACECIRKDPLPVKELELENSFHDAAGEGWVGDEVHEAVFEAPYLEEDFRQPRADGGDVDTAALLGDPAGLVDHTVVARRVGRIGPREAIDVHLGDVTRQGAVTGS